MIVLPKAGRGRRSAEQSRAYQQDLEQFAATIQQIDSRLDFSVSSRGWCYILEEHGLTKGDFNRAQDLINDCRKSGLLPIGICAEDGARGYQHVELLDTADPNEYLKEAIDSMSYRIWSYEPFSFWADKSVYLQMWVEKIDLKLSLRLHLRRSQFRIWRHRRESRYQAVDAKSESNHIAAQCHIDQLADQVRRVAFEERPTLRRLPG